MEERRLTDAEVGYIRVKAIIGDIAVPLDFGLSPDSLQAPLYDVQCAMLSSLSKHGKVTSDPVRGVTTCGEELGEAMAEALDATRPSGHVSGSIHRMYQELAQLAGYTILLMVSMAKIAQEDVNA